VGQDRNPSGLPDYAQRPVASELFLGNVQGPSLAKVLGKGLFLVFHNPPVNQEACKMGPPQGSAAGSSPDFPVVQVQSQLFPDALKEAQVSFFPFAPYFRQRFPKTGANFSEPQAEEVEFAMDRHRLIVDVEFDPRNEFDALSKRLLPGLLQAIYGVMISQGYGGKPPFLGGLYQSGGAQVAVGSSGMGM
jgi:hypothetical protein